jgi:aminoglycoside phosphotransferase (APT) family kinase protein
VIGRTLPEPLGTILFGGTVAGVESYATGPPLSNLIREWGRPTRRKLDDVRLVFDWLQKFHREAQVTRDPWSPAAMQRWVEEPCSRYEAAFGERPDEKRLFEAVRERARDLLGMPLPIVWAHPDLTGANIHVDGRRITVIDWSGAAPRLPLFDLLYFVMLVTCRMRGLSHRYNRAHHGQS